MELANRGTIFLDENRRTSIGHASQAAARCSMSEVSGASANATGGRIDVRILQPPTKICATAVARIISRRSFFFRVAAVPITIPSLRERGDDVLMLA